MKTLLPLRQIETRHRRQVGGKALALAAMLRSGIHVPDGLCITTAAYRQYTQMTGLDARVALELGRLPLAQMRWEEIWDMALRIRNLFITAPIPDDLQAALAAGIAARFGQAAVVVRSSSPQEDRSTTSFAGLHDSYVNIRGTAAVLEHVRLVWASLWSDGALLYRRELGMDLNASAMAVIVQELVDGECSGVAFSRGPDGADHAVVEAVYGLNQGLVDGTVTPDRWTLDRRTGAVLAHTPAVRTTAVQTTAHGTQAMPLPAAKKATPPLDADALDRVLRLAMDLENRQGCPQDVEWTWRGATLYLLQCRPVTTTGAADPSDRPWSADDKRPWYQSLKRSFANLQVLHRRIADELLPRMAADADRLAAVDPAGLTDAALIDAIHARQRIHQHWLDVYWRDFIPFAHGARLFGQVYNDLVKPDDPYAFTALLGATGMTGVQRNQDLQALAAMIRADDRLRERLGADAVTDLPPAFARGMDAFVATYGDATFQSVRLLQDRPGLIRLLLEMAARPEPTAAAGQPDIQTLGDDFIARFPAEQRGFARELLDLGRASYRLRDNDNIALARIEAQLIKAVDEAKRRIGPRRGMNLATATPEQVARMLSDPAAVAQTAVERLTVDEPIEHHGRPGLTPRSGRLTEAGFALRARQIIGQPAGQGLAVGPARVIASVEDLFRFKAGEILVCDAIDPNMTVVVPLAAAIVERRGGMLVHGAIIAREYGLPCITGVAEATTLIRTGDRLTVDGYLGVVTVDASGAD